MQPIHQEFSKDKEVVEAIQDLRRKNIDEDNIYVLTHDEDRTERIADHAEADTIGLDEETLGTAARNVFRKKGEELRAKLEELGFEEYHAEELEEKLDEGKVLVVVKDAPAGMEID
ncbi:general stress protein [Alkalicoccus chagannorensis]|uniref:general stress protein n=1 Tax=Alkalicoccus chagannorensis TaxID=427072 RepID=UPI0004269CFF|nr:general stress protein [Alkalicoccus chagannorensis]